MSGLAISLLEPMALVPARSRQKGLPTFLEQFIVDSVNGKLTRQGQGLGVLGVEGMLPRHPRGLREEEDRAERDCQGEGVR